MKKFLYKDLYDQEDSHWWHIAKREVVKELVYKYLKKNKCKILDIGCGTGKTLKIYITLDLFGESIIHKKQLNFVRKED